MLVKHELLSSVPIRGSWEVQVGFGPDAPPVCVVTKLMCDDVGLLGSIIRADPSDRTAKPPPCPGNKNSSPTFRSTPRFS